MSRYLWTFWLLPAFSFAQSYAPAPGQPGSTAIHFDSTAIVAWASGVDIVRGWLDVQDFGLGVVSYGSDLDALGIADGQPVSLGDGGVAVLTFPNGIANGPGPDFAVFENGFADHYMELALVEVSSDGVNFWRFWNISEIPTEVQLDNFSFSNCGYVHNLAGKYRVMYGTPFDLEELAGTPNLDVNHVTHVRLIDVVGTIDPFYGTPDSDWNLINDPYPTPFASGGFDLDAVAVLHEANSSGLAEQNETFQLYPNPGEEKIWLSLAGEAQYELRDAYGKLWREGWCTAQEEIDVADLVPGIYLLCVQQGSHRSVQKWVKR
jgi:hypothetical protein